MCRLVIPIEVSGRDSSSTARLHGARVGRKLHVQIVWCVILLVCGKVWRVVLAVLGRDLFGEKCKAA